MDTALKAKDSGCHQIFSTKKDLYKGIRSFCQTIQNIGMVVAECSEPTGYPRWIHTTRFGGEMRLTVHATTYGCMGFVLHSSQVAEAIIIYKL